MLNEALDRVGNPPSIEIVPTGGGVGAEIRNLDVRRLDEQTFGRIHQAWIQYQVLLFRGQSLSDAELIAFSRRFGNLDVAPNQETGQRFVEGYPEIYVVSNVVENGRVIGSLGSGEAVWHTDMSYRDVMGFVNVLYGLKIPRRDGKPLGGTEFANMHAAYDDLPQDLKTRLADATVMHDFEKFWEMMRREKGSPRPAMTAEQKAQRPPVNHPLFLTHPLTGRKVLYCNPGYAVRINGLPEQESEALLSFLFEHQLQPKYRYTHEWTENDLLIWDHLGTIHQAIADYRPDEIRLIKRCQVMATRVFTPEFRALAQAA